MGLQLDQPQDAVTTTYHSASTVGYNPHNTRFRTPLKPEEEETIRYTKLRKLGNGAQAQVHKVVDMHTGDYYACKIITVKEQVPELRIYSERDFKARVEIEINLVQALKHVSRSSTITLSVDGRSNHEAFRITSSSQFAKGVYTR